MPTRSSSSVRVFYPRLDRGALIRRLEEGIVRLDARLPLVRVVLFGSWAKGRHTVASDIDLLVVYRGEARADAYALARRTLDVPGIEPHLYTEAEYQTVAGTVDRMIEGGVVLFSR
jgi:predicted nucleotidyltransferase